MRNMPAMKLPMVFCEAKPTAAPPIAETDKIHSDGNPPARLIAATAAINIRILNVRAKLLDVFGSSLARLEKLDRYRVITRSIAIAIKIIAMISMTSVKGIPNRPPDGVVGDGSVGVGVDMAFVHLYAQLTLTLL
jgi:hypothetical protein